MNRRAIGIVGGGVVVGLAVVGIAWARTGDGREDAIGSGGWVRVEDHPTGVAAGGTDGGPVRVVSREESGTAVLEAYHSQGFRADTVVLEGSADVAGHPFAVAADGPSGAPWVVVGGGEDVPLVAWSGLGPLGDDAQQRTSRATGATLPGSEGAVKAVAVTTEYHQVVAAVDQDEARVLVWARYADGAWQRSALDLPAVGASADRGLVDALKLTQDGNRFVLGTVSGDPATLSLWASEEVRGDGPVAAWAPITDAPAGEQACDIAALHWTPGAGVLLGWWPLTSSGCEDEVHFTLVGHPDADDIPALGPGREALVSDALALGDGTAIAVGSVARPPHDGTGDEVRVPALWARPAGQGWEPVTAPDLTAQLGREATTVSVGSGTGELASLDAVDQLLVATTPRAIGPGSSGGVAVWAWEADADDDA